MMTTQAEIDRALEEHYAAGFHARDREVEELQQFKPINELVVVSRKWHEPQIRVKYLTDGIMIEMSVHDFVYSVAQALRRKLPPRPSWWWRLWMGEAGWLNYHAALENSIRTVMEDVLHEMKMATIHSPPPLSRAQS